MGLCNDPDFLVGLFWIFKYRADNINRFSYWIIDLITVIRDILNSKLELNQNGSDNKYKFYVNVIDNGNDILSRNLFVYKFK